MSHIAELVVRNPNLTLTTTLAEISDLDISVEYQPLMTADAPTLFYRVQTADFDRFESALSSDHTVASWEVDAEMNDSRIYKIEYTDETKILTPAEFGLRVLDATGVDGGWHIRVHASERSHIEGFLRYCREENVQCHLKKVYSTHNGAGAADGTGGGLQLTERQRDVALTATEMGYFESEGANATEVADALDISRSTLSSHLRAITAKMYEYHFKS